MHAETAGDRESAASPLPGPAARPGDPVSAIATPALVLDLDALERNVAAMQRFAAQHALRLRPHAKTHKSARIAQLQIAAGAVGVCVQKASEAVVLAAGGVADIAITNEVIDPAKLAAVARLARRVRLAIAVDSVLGVDRLAAAMRDAGAAIDVLVEIDVGHGRCGVAPADAADLARRVAQAAPAGLRWAGLQAYHGAAQHLRSRAERAAAIEHAAAAVRQAMAGLSAVGLTCPLVTGAGTGSFVHETASGLWGELQAGSYVFMDRDYADNADGAAFEHALFVKTQVISRCATHAVVDAGHKSHAIDSGPPRIWQRRLAFANAGDEHGLVRAAGEPLPELGEPLWLVPGHCDPTVNLHDHYVAVRGGLERGVVDALWPVDARGCVR